MRTKSQARRRATTRLCVQALEDRCQPTGYAVTDLGTLGGLSAVAYDINEVGQVVGYSTNVNSLAHGFRWEKGVMTDLGALGGNSSYAFALNDAGQIAGQSRTAAGGSATNAFLWDSGAMTNLGGTTTRADGINDAGQVVGGMSNFHAFLWDDGVLTDLGTLDFGGGGYAFAYDINNAGQIVGSSAANGFGPNNPLPGRAALWQKGVITNLGAFAGDDESVASAINEFGQIVGTSSFTDPNTYEVTSRSFLWQNGVMTALAVPSFQSSAADINDSGQIVGAMRSAGGFSNYHAFVYSDGVVTDLNTLIPAGTGLTLASAAGINNRGQIVGHALDSTGRNHAVLLTPMPDTPTISMNDVTVTEGNTGTRSAVFTVNLSTASSQTVTVHFSTTNGSATGGDYQAASGLLTFAPGQTMKTVTVPINGDRIAEPNETFFINLTQASNATIIGDGQGVGAITDDEPRISISTVVSNPEGGRGTTTLFVFTVSLSTAYDQPVTTSYRTVNGTATSSDFNSKTGTITFAPGEVTKTITIQVIGDGKRESNEYFFVDLFGASSNALFGNYRGMGSILNDD